MATTNNTEHTMYDHEPTTLDGVDERTSFASGEKFETEAEVRAYFTADAQVEVWGKYAFTDEDELERMATLVIENRWHMVISDEDAIAAGVQKLGAVPEGNGETYTYSYRVTADEVADLGRRLLEGEVDAYSRWCQDTVGEDVAPSE